LLIVWRDTPIIAARSSCRIRGRAEDAGQAHRDGLGDGLGHEGQSRTLPGADQHAEVAVENGVGPGDLLKRRQRHMEQTCRPGSQGIVGAWPAIDD